MIELDYLTLELTWQVMHRLFMAQDLFLVATLPSLVAILDARVLSQLILMSCAYGLCRRTFRQTSTDLKHLAGWLQPALASQWLTMFQSCANAQLLTDELYRIVRVILEGRVRNVRHPLRLCVLSSRLQPGLSRATIPTKGSCVIQFWPYYILQFAMIDLRYLCLFVVKILI